MAHSVSPTVTAGAKNQSPVSGPICNHRASVQATYTPVTGSGLAQSIIDSKDSAQSRLYTGHCLLQVVGWPGLL